MTKTRWRGATCFECGERAQTYHHVVPFSLGGTRTLPLCFSCHDKVHARGAYKIEDTDTLGTTGSVLTKAGLRRARERGVILGRPSAKSDPEMVEKLIEGTRLIWAGVGIRRAAEVVGVPLATFHRVFYGW